MRFIEQLGALYKVLERFCQHFWIKLLVTIIVIVVTAICVIQPEIDILKRLSSQTVLIMLLWLMMGVGFLMLRSRRLAVTSLMCSAVLCLYLKNASNISLAAPQVVLDQKSKFTVSHFNLSSIQGTLSGDLELIDQLHPDILVFQEFTPQFRDQIVQHYDSLYTDKTEFVRMDDYGQVIFTSLPVLAKDTFLIYNMPLLRIRIQMRDGNELQLLSHYNLPPLTSQYKEDSKLVFSQLSNFIAQAQEPVLYLGTLNYVAWDNILIRFRYEANLNDSRKSFFPSFGNNENSLFYAPVDHIYYNEYLDCLQFKKIENADSKKIGIRGEYQINNHEEIYTSTQE